MEFLAAAKHIRAELITIRTLLRDDRSEFCWMFWALFEARPGLRVGVSSPPEDEESSS